MSHLYLLRHAEAEPDARNDFQRELTDKGANQSRRVAHFLMSRDIRPEVVITSPVTRAKQTAERVCLQASLPMPVEEAFLACGMTPDTAFEELLAYTTKFDHVLMVGHEPDLSEFIAAAIGVHEPNSIKVRKASLIGLSFGRLTPGAATLEYNVPARMMKD